MSPGAMGSAEASFIDGGVIWLLIKAPPWGWNGQAAEAGCQAQGNRV
jgi:hypothetical protein